MRASTASSTPRSPAPKTTAGATISPAARANEASAAERAAALQRSSKAVFPYPRGRPPPPTAKPPAIGKPTSCCSPDTAKPCSPSTIAILGCCWQPGRPTRRQRVSPHISWRSSKHSHQGCDALSPSIMAPSSHAISCSAVSPSRLTSAIPMPLGRRVASKTPSVVCAASSRAKPISPLSPTSVSTTSSAAITTPLENALTSQPRRRSSKKCCTSTLNPPPRPRADERRHAPESLPRLELGAEREAAGPATRTGRGQESALLLLLVEIGAIEHGPHLLLKQIVQRYGPIADGIVLLRYPQTPPFPPLHPFRAPPP